MDTPFRGGGGEEKRSQKKINSLKNDESKNGPTSPEGDPFCRTP